LLVLVQRSPETRTKAGLGVEISSGDGGRRWRSQGTRLSLAELGESIRR
jgi:hypothetical protein